MRAAVKELQAAPTMTDPARAAFGITVPDTDPTPVGPPTSRPVLVVDTSNRWTHGISFRDEATPDSRAKPAGARGVEIWCAYGPTPPVGPGECAYLATDTASPYVATHDPAKAGQLAHYMGRWVSTRGETGPWSETVTATVTG